jgi:23S rRNA (cytosine1962-C5)-methyltransferase
VIPLDPRLAALRQPSSRRIAVRVTPDALRVIRSGHPWVYDRSIRSISVNGEPGDLAVVFDDRKRFAAIGLWDPASPIRIKILHVGEPVQIDAGWWDGRIERSILARRTFTDRSDASELAYRLVNGESDGIAGLVVDRYASTLVVKIYSAAIAAHLRPIVSSLCARTEADGVVVRLGRSVPAADLAGLVDGDVLAGSVQPGPVEFVEHGLRFGADVRHGQKTGFFLDQRVNPMAI